MKEEPMAPTRIRIMVVDDHPIVRDGVLTSIGAEPDMEVVAGAGTGEEAIALYRQHRPDVVLMDLRLPGLSGSDAMRVIHQEFPDSRFVVLTTYDGDADVSEALSAGARGYLLKGASRQEIVTALRTVHAGGRYIPLEVADRLADRIAASELTGRERQVLRLMAKGLSNKEIAASLEIAESTVKWYVLNIIGKLQVENRVQAVRVGLKRGLVKLD
jgi:DNA-binding NarL/FixJ family response regulator